MSRRSQSLLLNSVAATTRPHLFLTRFLDLNGDGTGTKNLIGDYSTPDIAYIQPPAGQIYHLRRIIIHIGDSGTLDAEGYGALATLTNGITLRVQDDSGTIINLTDGVPIKGNVGYGRFCYDVSALSFGTGNNYAQIRWTFQAPIELSGDRNERFEVLLADNFTGLVEHYFVVQGYRIK